MTLKPARLQWSEDGSVVSIDYGDVYFQRGQGAAESDYVFLTANHLPERFAAPAQKAFVIGETGFGTGLNFLRTCHLFEQTAPAAARLVFVSYERQPVSVTDLARIFNLWPESVTYTKEILAQYPPLISGHHQIVLAGGRIRLHLVFGDMRETLPDTQMQADAWFLDGFAPAHNPDAWEDELLQHIFDRTVAGGTLSSFTSVGAVRRGLKKSGFEVKKIKGFAKKWSMTIARKTGGLEQRARPDHVIVAGAGIAGCSAARALAERGIKVTLIDRHAGPAQETSGNPWGVIYPKMTADSSPADTWHQHAFCYVLQQLQRLQVKSWKACGVKHINMTPDDEKRHQDIVNRRKFPTDYARFDDGLQQDLAGMVAPQDFCRSLIDHPNIDAKFGTDFDVTSGFAVPVVIATGIGVKLLPQVHFLHLQSLRGQVTSLKNTAQSAALSSVQCHDGYITPAVDGLHMIGATFQKDREDTNIDAADNVENLLKLNAALPELGFTEMDITGARAGVRLTTPDKLPLIGPLPEAEKTIAVWASLRQGQNPDAPAIYHPDLYLCAGFGAHGLTDAPLAGDILAALILDEPLPVPLSLFQHLRPERFLWRDLKRKKI